MLLRFDAYKQQREAASYWIDQETVEIGYGGAKYGGKSFLGCNLIFHDALVYPETQYFIARESLNDLRKYTVPSVMEVFQSWGIRFDDYGKFNGQDNFFQFKNDSRVLLLQACELPSDPLFERFGSMQMTRGWIEESGQVSEAARRNLLASVGRWKNKELGLKKKILYTFNPKKPHWVERDFFRPWSEGTLPKERKFVRALPKDNIKGNQDYIQSLANITDPVMRARLYEGSFDYDNDPHRIVDAQRLANAFTNAHVEPGKKCLICDVALLGSDDMVISYFSGWRLEEIEVIPKANAPEAIAHIERLALKYGVERSNIVIDSDGIGGPIAHHLPGCYQFVANGSVIDMKLPGEPVNYAKLKDQCAFHAAGVINSGGFFVAPTSHQDRLINEVSTWKRDKVDDDGKVRIEPKAKQKEALGGKSPDIGDTILMRSVLDLTPTPTFAEALAQRVDSMPAWEDMTFNERGF